MNICEVHNKIEEAIINGDTVEARVLIRTARKMGQRMENRLLDYRRAIEVLGFERIKQENRIVKTERKPPNNLDSKVQKYKIGNKGPAGGYIFYDKSNYTSGWQYLEAAPEDINKVCDWKEANSVCKNLIVYGFKDWFLPSKDELNLMYKNLHKEGIGGFADDDYWSSSEGSAFNAWKQYFNNGIQYLTNKDFNLRVRAARMF